MAFHSALKAAAIASVFLSPLAGGADEIDAKTTRPAQEPPRPHETVGDTQRVAPPDARRTSPARLWMRGPYVSVQVNVDEDGANIIDDAANEPSIAVDPTDPNRMAIGWRQFDSIYSDFRQAGVGYTTDNGRSWTFPGVLDPGVFRSDPVLASDASGNFYYNSLTVDDYYYCSIFKSNDGGVTWSDPIYAYGGDKAWMAIDRTGGIGHGNNYSAWDYAAAATTGSPAPPTIATRSITPCPFPMSPCGASPPSARLARSMSPAGAHTRTRSSWSSSPPPCRIPSSRSPSTFPWKSR